VYVEGAQRGDVLVITIEDIVVDSYSWIAIGPRRGPLGDSTRWPELSSDYTTKIFQHSPGPSGTTRDGTLHFSDRISWPITPFVGTSGFGGCPRQSRRYRIHRHRRRDQSDGASEAAVDKKQTRSLASDREA